MSPSRWCRLRLRTSNKTPDEMTGGSANGRVHAPAIRTLAAGSCGLTVDLFGHGKSASPAGGYDIPAQARRVGAALDRLGAPSTLSLSEFPSLLSRSS